MPPAGCQHLDDYLAGDRPDFAAHLSECADCRQAVREHENLAALLTRATAAPPPDDLVLRIRRHLRRTRRRRLAWAGAALATAAAAGWWTVTLTPPPEVPTALEQSVVAEVPPPVRVTFPRGDVIALPAETGSPNVTFVLVYPAPTR